MLFNGAWFAWRDSRNMYHMHILWENTTWMLYNIVGIQESVYEISMNLKENVLGSNV